jgi:DNA-binding response OmpR family regulator
MARILIADDDPLVSSFIERGLQASGYTTVVVGHGELATTLGLTEDFDLLILDLVMPDRNGFDVLQELRSKRRPLPVLVLTGRPELRDAVACLDVGADDYMTKPFRFEELLARVRARLRPQATEEVDTLRAGGIELDIRARRARVGDRQVDLTGREFALLERFMRHPGQVLSREQLLSDVWGYYFDPGTNVVPVYVRSLRNKLGVDVIETVRGVGYRLSDVAPPTA